MYSIPQCTSIPMTILDVIFVISVLYAAEVFFFVCKCNIFLPLHILTLTKMVPMHVHSQRSFLDILTLTYISFLLSYFQFT